MKQIHSVFHIFLVNSSKTTLIHHKHASLHASPRLTLSCVNSASSLPFPLFRFCFSRRQSDQRRRGTRSRLQWDHVWLYRWFWIAPANIEYYVICLSPNLCNLRIGGKYKRRLGKQRRQAPMLSKLFCSSLNCNPAHCEVISVASFICSACVYHRKQFFKAQASRTTIRGQSRSSVMQRCGCHPQGLALLEMRVGGISQAL